MKEIIEKENKTATEIPESKIFPYEKPGRFGVAFKLQKWERFRCNFKKLHETKESAETEALRLANTKGGQFYVVEILSITSST